MSPGSTPGVLGLGNAIVDVLARVDDAFLERHGLVKGSMALIDAQAAETLYAPMDSAVERSAANTMAAVASLGGRAAYVGRVRDDALGRVFTEDIRATGVTFETRPARAGPSTARSMVLVTPDAQRTMQTYLGASAELGPEDLDREQIAAAGIVFLEGYLWDPEPARGALLLAARIAREAGRRVALTLSDRFCVERHLDELRAFVDGSVDVLFANEVEALALTGTASFDGAAAALRGRCPIAVITRSEKGSIILHGSDTIELRAERPTALVDTTGAGDLYAGGFLFGLSEGRDLPTCGRIGSIAAAEVISHVGARPETPLQRLVAERLGTPQ
jgi:sugar/nucleoside kinase (ribokinase family)